MLLAANRLPKLDQHARQSDNCGQSACGARVAAVGACAVGPKAGAENANKLAARHAASSCHPPCQPASETTFASPRAAPLSTLHLCATFTLAKSCARLCCASSFAQLQVRAGALKFATIITTTTKTTTTAVQCNKLETQTNEKANAK